MYVKPKISQQQAENMLASGKSSFPFAAKLFSRKNLTTPERLEVVHLPFFLFDVTVKKETKGKKEGFSSRQNVSLSVDGLVGHAVLYAKDALDVEKSPKKTTPACDFEISADNAAKIALDQYKGILLEHGLRTRSHPSAEEISEGRKIYYPFWVGYFKKKRGYDFKALDAVSGEIQGVRMRKLFMNALRKIG